MGVGIYLAKEEIRTVWYLACALWRLRNLKLPPAEPHLASHQDENVNWWQLLAAGFEASIPPTYTLNQLGLAGRPWRVLRRGSTVVPVYRARQLNNIKPQHRIRIAAYCLLIREAAVDDSPYGIVLGPTGYDGIAIKVDQQQMAYVKNARTALSQTFDKARRGHDPPSPTDDRKCRNCPLAEPIPVASFSETHTDLRGSVVLPRAMYPADRDTPYASFCGSRYRWVPHHAKLDNKHWRS